MTRKTTKIIFVSIAIIAIIAVAFVLYFKFNSDEDSITNEIEFGHEYHLTEFRPSERFAGVNLDQASYIKFNEDQQTGELYLKGLSASATPIPFIVTNYKQKSKETIIDFEYIIDQGEKTAVQSLQAISANNSITIKTIESHSIQYIIAQDPEEIDKLEYSVISMVFSKEIAK